MGKDNGLRMQIFSLFLTQILALPILFIWGNFPEKRLKDVVPFSITIELNRKQLDLKDEVFLH